MGFIDHLKNKAQNNEDSQKNQNNNSNKTQEILKLQNELKKVMMNKPTKQEILQEISINRNNQPINQPQTKQMMIQRSLEIQEQEEKLIGLAFEQIQELIEVDSKLNQQIKDLKNDLVNTKLDIQTNKDEIQNLKKKLDLMDKNLERFMVIYELVTNQYNPFVENQDTNLNKQIKQSLSNFEEQNKKNNKENKNKQNNEELNENYNEEKSKIKGYINKEQNTKYNDKTENRTAEINNNSEKIENVTNSQENMNTQHKASYSEVSAKEKDIKNKVSESFGNQNKNQNQTPIQKTTQTEPNVINAALNDLIFGMNKVINEKFISEIKNELKQIHQEINSIKQQYSSELNSNKINYNKSNIELKNNPNDDFFNSQNIVTPHRLSQQTKVQENKYDVESINNTNNNSIKSEIKLNENQDSNKIIIDDKLMDLMKINQQATDFYKNQISQNKFNNQFNNNKENKIKDDLNIASNFPNYKSVDFDNSIKASQLNQKSTHDDLSNLALELLESNKELNLREITELSEYIKDNYKDLHLANKLLNCNDKIEVVETIVEHLDNLNENK